MLFGSGVEGLGQWRRLVLNKSINNNLLVIIINNKLINTHKQTTRIFFSSLKKKKNHFRHKINEILPFWFVFTGTLRTAIILIVMTPGAYSPWNLQSPDLPNASFGPKEPRVRGRASKAAVLFGCARDAKELTP